MTRQPEVYNKSKNALPTLLKAWLLAGTLDGLSAVIYSTIRGNKNPEKIFSYIASGLFGKDSGIGENAMILWGVLFHYVIAFIFTVFFFFFYSKIKLLSKNKIIIAIIYGLFVWVIMNLIVVPNSNTPKFPFKMLPVIINMVILMAMIGLPLSFIIGNYYSTLNRHRHATTT